MKDSNYIEPETVNEDILDVIDKVLPYYKIQKTREDKEFYFAHEGYFNFWDEYLICHLNKINWVIVNKTKRKFERAFASNVQRATFNLMFEQSVRKRIPKEMFIDFPELESLRYNYLKNNR